MKRSLLALAVVVSLASLASAQVPQILEYQGRLADTAGNAVADGDYTVVLAIYDVPTGGAALWSGSRTVSTKKGLFATTLGPLSLTFSTQYYLGVKVGADDEMTPRIQLATMPYAFNADRLDALDSGDLQRRVSGSCGTGSSVRVVNADGTVTCETAVSGNAGTASQLKDDPADCAANAFATAIAANGNLTCAALTDAAVPDTITASSYALKTGDTFSGAVNFPGSGVWNSSGNVGIGTTSPAAKLHVAGWVNADGITENGRLLVGGPGETTDISFSTAAGWDQVLISTAGNVGIGTTNPGDRLHVIGQARIDNDAGAGAAGCFRYSGSELQYSNNCSSFNSFSASSAGGWTDDGTVVRLTTGSDLVGIGTTNPSSGYLNPLLHLFNTAHLGIVLEKSNSPAAKWQIGTGGDGTDRLDIATVIAGNVPRLTILGNGNVGIGTSNPASRLDLAGGCMTGSICSDARMKINVRPLGAPVLDRVMRLVPSTFEWRAPADGKQRIGMVAQQVEEVFPEVVTTAADGTNKGLECTGLSAITIQAVKEQQAQISDLRSEIESLRADREALRVELARRSAQVGTELAAMREVLRRLREIPLLQARSGE